jgi:hypothetical protein
VSGEKIKKEGKEKFLSGWKGASSFANFGLCVGFERFANVLDPVRLLSFFTPIVHSSYQIVRLVIFKNKSKIQIV